MGASDLIQLVGSGHLGLVLGPIGIGSRIDASELAPAVARFQSAGVPVVAFGDEAPGTLDRVVPDHRAGAHALVVALHAAGHRRLWQVAPRDVAGVPWWEERRAGYEEGMHAVGLPLLPVLEVPPRDENLSFDEQARSLVGHLLPAVGPAAREPADALLALNDHHALVLSRACRLLGSRVTIAGYDAVGDDLPGRAEEPGIPRYTVDPCWWDCGRKLIQVLAQRKREGAGTNAIRELVAPQVVGT